MILLDPARHVVYPQTATATSAGCGDCDACGGRRLPRRSSSPGADRSLSGIINCGCPRSGAGLRQFVVASVRSGARSRSCLRAASRRKPRDALHEFVGVYVIATPISLLSLVPGGLGVFETMVVAFRAQYVESGLARLPHRLSLDLFRVAACVGDPSCRDLRDAALVARVGLAKATAQRHDQKRQTRSRPSSSMTVADLLSHGINRASKRALKVAFLEALRGLTADLWIAPKRFRHSRSARSTALRMKVAQARVVFDHTWHDALPTFDFLRRGSEGPIRNSGGRAHRLTRRHPEGVPAPGQEAAPDLNPGNKESEERFKETAGAYDLLSDPDKRPRFDSGEIDASGSERPPAAILQGFCCRGSRGPCPTRTVPASRILPSRRYLCRVVQAAGTGIKARTWAGLALPPAIEFLDAVNGATKRLTLPEGGSLDVTIPSGIQEGQILRLRGKGAPSLGEGEAGDALVEISINPHRFFTRHGDDIHLDLPVTLAEAVLGARIRVPTPTGPSCWRCRRDRTPILFSA